jgi:hypothetical protein
MVTIRLPEAERRALTRIAHGRGSSVQKLLAAYIERILADGATGRGRAA